MEKSYKQLTFGNSSQRKEFIGVNKMKKTKMYSAEEEAYIFYYEWALDCIASVL